MWKQHVFARYTCATAYYYHLKRIIMLSQSFSMFVITVFFYVDVAVVGLYCCNFGSFELKTAMIWASIAFLWYTKSLFYYFFSLSLFRFHCCVLLLLCSVKSFIRFVGVLPTYSEISKTGRKKERLQIDAALNPFSVLCEQANERTRECECAKVQSYRAYYNNNKQE